MKILVLFYVILLLTTLVPAFSQAQTYKYDLQVTETQVLKKVGSAVILIREDEARPVKKYDCELTVTVSPSNQIFKGGSADYDFKATWIFQAQQEIGTYVSCPGDGNGSRIGMLNSTSFQGNYEETSSRYDSKFTNTHKFPNVGTRGDLETVRGSTPDIGKRLLFWHRDQFDPMQVQTYEGQTDAYYVISEIPKNLMFGKTPTELKFENGKLSGFSDELIFSGTYQLK